MAWEAWGGDERSGPFPVNSVSLLWLLHFRWASPHITFHWASSRSALATSSGSHKYFSGVFWVLGDRAVERKSQKAIGNPWSWWAENISSSIWCLMLLLQPAKVMSGNWGIAGIKKSGMTSSWIAVGKSKVRRWGWIPDDKVRFLIIKVIVFLCLFYPNHWGKTVKYIYISLSTQHRPGTSRQKIYEGREH